MNQDIQKPVLISIIIPVYNTGLYLDECIESVVDQSFKDLEIILVDDGSTDDCSQKCDEWIKRDSRISVIHKKNGGSAQARNAALDLCTGRFIFFVDSDDALHHEILKTLHNIIIMYDVDIAECDYSENEEIISSNTRPENGHIQVFTAEQAMEKSLNDQLFCQIIWNKLYRASLVKSIRFMEGKTIDDEFWTYQVLGCAHKLAHIESALYFYRQHSTSIMHQPYSIKRLSAIEAYALRHDYICIHFPGLAQNSLVILWFGCRYHGQMSILYLSGEERRIAFFFLNKVLNDYPIPLRVVFAQKQKERLWLLLEKLSLKLVCKIRNTLKIGL